MTSAGTASTALLKQAIKEEAGRLGFVLAGFTTPDPPPHLPTFEQWLAQGRHGSMGYLGMPRARARRADPRLILPACRSILVLGAPYPDPSQLPSADESARWPASGRIAAYAWGTDYHLVLPARLQGMSAFIEAQVGHAIASRWYTDTGPLLERDLAQRAGLGWIGRNTCLINPARGSYFLLAEILLDLEIEPDTPFPTDHCGSCTRCIQACPTACILPDRTIDARRCISYLTIELHDSIPAELRTAVGDWIFGCDTCQIVCPWNRFSASEGDAAFRAGENSPRPSLLGEVALTPEGFSKKYRNSPIRRAKHRGHLRNVTVALGNGAGPEAILALEAATQNPDPMIREQARWAVERIAQRMESRA